MLKSLRAIVVEGLARARRRSDTQSTHLPPLPTGVYREIADRASQQGLAGELRFDDGGLLEPGIYELSWEAFTTAFGSNAQRQLLVEGLGRLLDILRESGCKLVYVGGSMVTRADRPQDFDACWAPDGVDEATLAGSEPSLLFRDLADAGTLTRKYGGTIEPMVLMPTLGATMLEFLQYDSRTGARKGVVAIRLDTSGQES